MNTENMISEQEEKKIFISLDELAAAMRACDETEAEEAAEKVDRLSGMIEGRNGYTFSTGKDPSEEEAQDNE